MKKEYTAMPLKGLVCSLLHVWKDSEGTLPAMDGDLVERVDWDNGEANAVTWDKDITKVILSVDVEGRRFLDIAFYNNDG